MLRISQLYVITNNNMLGRFSTIKNLMLQQGHIFFYWLFLFIIYPKKCKAMWIFVKCFKFYHSFFFPFIDGSVGSKNICRLSSKIFVYWKAQKRWRTRTFRPFTYAISTKSAHTGILKLKKNVSFTFKSCFIMNIINDECSSNQNNGKNLYYH